MRFVRECVSRSESTQTRSLRPKCGGLHEFSGKQIDLVQSFAN